MLKHFTMFKRSRDKDQNKIWKYFEKLKCETISNILSTAGLHFKTCICLSELFLSPNIN